MQALVLDNCPPALSLGVLCDDEGYNYSWTHNEKPILSKGNIRVELSPSQGVPTVVSAQETDSEESSVQEDLHAAGSDE